MKKDNKILKDLIPACIPEDFIKFYRIIFVDSTQIILYNIEQIYGLLFMADIDIETIKEIQCIVDTEKMLYNTEVEINEILTTCFESVQ